MGYFIRGCNPTIEERHRQMQLDTLHSTITSLVVRRVALTRRQTDVDDGDHVNGYQNRRGMTPEDYVPHQERAQGRPTAYSKMPVRTSSRASQAGMPTPAHRHRRARAWRPAAAPSTDHLASAFHPDLPTSRKEEGSIALLLLEGNHTAALIAIQRTSRSIVLSLHLGAPAEEINAGRTAYKFKLLTTLRLKSTWQACREVTSLL